MNDLDDLATSLHAFNSWLVITSGAVALGLALAALVGARRFGSTGRLSIWAFLATLAAQAALGVLIAATASSGSEPFDGSTSELVWHALGGVLAIAFAATALIRTRHRPTDRAAGRTAAIWTALGVLSVGAIVISIPLAALVTGVRLRTARPPDPGTSDRSDRPTNELTQSDR